MTTPVTVVWPQVTPATVTATDQVLSVNFIMTPQTYWTPHRPVRTEEAPLIRAQTFASIYKQVQLPLIQPCFDNHDLDGMAESLSNNRAKSSLTGRVPL